MTRLTARRRPTTTPTCTGRRWSCPHPGCDAYDDTAWTRIGAWAQWWQHRRNNHR